MALGYQRELPGNWLAQVTFDELITSASQKHMKKCYFTKPWLGIDGLLLLTAHQITVVDSKWPSDGHFESTNLVGGHTM